MNLLSSPCPICDAGLSNSSLIARENFIEKELGIRICLNCDFLFTWPRAIDPQRTYNQAEKISWEKKYGAIAKGEVEHDRHKNFLEEMTVVNNYVPEGKILDIGCNAGWFLEHLLRHPNYQPEGLESSPVLAEICRRRLNIPVYQNFSQLSNRKDSFSGITVIDVIEHVNPEDINSFIDNISKIIKPGGYLFIKTPNGKFTRIKGWLAGLLTPKLRRALLGVEDVWDAKEHVIHWSTDTLSRILFRYNFKTVKTFVPLPVQTRGSPITAIAARKFIYLTAYLLNGRRRVPAFAQDIFLIAQKNINKEAISINGKRGM